MACLSWSAQLGCTTSEKHPHQHGKRLCHLRALDKFFIQLKLKLPSGCTLLYCFKGTYLYWSSIGWLASWLCIWAEASCMHAAGLVMKTSDDASGQSWDLWRMWVNKADNKLCLNQIFVRFNAMRQDPHPADLGQR